MASAISIILGATSIVAKEIASAGLVPPAEQAYYKAESHIEQGLAYKKYNPAYVINNVSELGQASDPYRGTPLVCAADPCFNSRPVNQADLLKDFFASTYAISPTNLMLESDIPQQFDLQVPDGATSSRGSLDLTFANLNGARGLEVTIVAFPKTPTAGAGTCGTAPGNYCGAAQQDSASPASGTITQTTPVLVDKVLLTAPVTNRQIPIGSGVRSTITDEPYPSLTNYVYRVRLRAMGATIPGVNVLAKLDNGTPLNILSSDFTVQAVAEAGTARRGIRVVVPATQVAGSIFDYVLFSEFSIEKYQAKAPPGYVPPIPDPVLTVEVYNDANRNCTKDPSEAGFPSVAVTVNGTTRNTNGSGSATFTGLNAYNATVAPTTNYSACAPNPQSGTLAGTSKTITFGLKIAYIPLYRLNYPGIGDHFYTIDPPEWAQRRDLISGQSGYTQENVTGYLAPIQIAGTVPFYRFWSNSLTDHYYSTVSTTPANYVSQGVSGYIVPYPGPAPGPYVPYNGNCPAGTTPLYRSVAPANDHFYTANLAEYNNSVNYGYVRQGVAGCIFPAA